MTSPASLPSLQEATNNSTSVWQVDLESLFHHAKDRFPDVVWELTVEEDDKLSTEEVWGHKAIVYARAPPSFQNRYFCLRQGPLSSPLPYSSSPNGTLPTASMFSLTPGGEIPGLSRSPSPFRADSPTPSTTPGTILRLSTSINPTLFANELEYLYTGKGFGEAFEFLFDTAESREEGDAEELRVDKLRKDLVFMWRSRLYSDVRIALTGNFSSNHEDTTAIFSSHRFVLISRSSYFYNALVSWPAPPKLSLEPLTLTLPSPPFTPASLHFTLGFIYTGTLVFSHRTYDLDTAFHIIRSATYLSIPTLYDEIQARIVQEMMHGLFHAFLEFSEYERLTGGKWGTGGCRCRQCARRAPRVLEFALADDVKNVPLDRGARRALVGLFGEGWCTAEFAALPQKLRDGLLKGVGKRTTPTNVFALLFAAEHALARLNAVIDAWADIVREMVMAGRKGADDCLASNSDESFAQPDWTELMESDGVRFEDGERVEWIMASVKRGLNDKNAATLYQTLVSSILLRPHPTEHDAPMLSSTSHIRVQVEQTRMDVLRYIRKRWLAIRQEGGFNQLEGWTVKEISDDIEVPVEDLLMLGAQKGLPTRASLRPNKADTDSDAVSMHSLRVSVLNRQGLKSNSSFVQREGFTSSTGSVKSVARSTHSTTSRISTSATGPSRKKQFDGTLLGPRPDSKLTPQTDDPSFPPSLPPSPSHKPTIVEPEHMEMDQPTVPSTPFPKTLVRPLSAASRRSITSRTSATAQSIKVKSSATSIRDSTTSLGSAGRSGLRPSRPNSSVSSTSDTSTTFKTANTAPPRSRRTSTSSTVSTVSVKTTVTVSSPVRTRRASGTSLASTVSKSAGKSSEAKLSPNTARRPPSLAPSVKSTASTVSTATSGARKFVVSVHKPLLQENKQLLAQPKSQRPANGQLNRPNGKGKVKTTELGIDRKVTGSPASGTIVSALKRKGSADTVTIGKAQPLCGIAKTFPTTSSQTPFPRGATLDIGIPCIISSKRKRFKAYARYIGEVEGELGPWVGVEVPVSETWAGDRDQLEGEGRQWHDGSWGGIRYFDIGNNGSEWDYFDDRMIRKRRVEGASGSMKDKGVLKREGEQLNVERVKRIRSASPATSDMSGLECRGLFVRPQQVLYVVDAVGPD